MPHEDDKHQLSEAEREELVRSTRRFDLRRIIGAVFLLYGIIITILGVMHYDSDAVKTGGIHINLWVGICLLIASGLFFLWDRFAPVPAEDIINNVEKQDKDRAAGEGQALG